MASLFFAKIIAGILLIPGAVFLEAFFAKRRYDKLKAEIEEECKRTGQELSMEDDDCIYTYRKLLITHRDGRKEHTWWWRPTYKTKEKSI